MSRLLFLACFLLLTGCRPSGKNAEKKAAEKPPAGATEKDQDGETRDLLDESKAADEEAKKAEQELRSRAQGSFFHAALYMAEKGRLPIDEAKELILVSDVYRRSKDRDKQLDVLGRSAAVLADKDLGDYNELVAAELMESIAVRLEGAPKDRIEDIAAVIVRAAEKMVIDEAGAKALGLTHAASAYVKAGDMKKARELLARALAAAKNIKHDKTARIEILARIAAVYFTAGSKKKAASIDDRIFALLPKIPEEDEDQPHIPWGRDWSAQAVIQAYLPAGMFAEALSTALVMVDERQKSIMLSSIALACIKDGNLLQAMETADAMEDLELKVLIMAEMYVIAGQTDKADELTAKILARLSAKDQDPAPYDKYRLTSLALSSAEAGRNEQALELLGHVSDLSRKDALSDMAAGYFKKGDVDRAVKLLSQACTIQTLFGTTEHCSELGDIAAKLSAGKHEPAFMVLVNAVKGPCLIPNLALAEARLALGHDKDVADILDKEFKTIRKRELPGLLNDLALLYAKAGACDKAFDTIRALDRPRPDLLAGLDVVYKEQGKELGKNEKELLSELVGGND
jgi:tetratricopeptide (TPR) repeat protein